ncbi:MAG: hypothetical protein IPK07_15730 [Deltaproteobacteria bacterium]|nr:hypothetical protein [Deltaproteobacteria bacterium]
MDLEASGIEELKALNLLFADYLMRYVGHDESRHVAFGVHYPAQRFPELSKARRDELQKKSDHWSSLVDATIASTRDDMAMVGIDVDHLAMRCTRDRQHRLADRATHELRPLWPAFCAPARRAAKHRRWRRGRRGTNDADPEMHGSASG